MAYTMYVNRAQGHATVHRTNCPLYETRLTEKNPLRYWARSTYANARAAKTSAHAGGTRRVSNCPLCTRS